MRRLTSLILGTLTLHLLGRCEDGVTENIPAEREVILDGRLDQYRPHILDPQQRAQVGQTADTADQQRQTAGETDGGTVTRGSQGDFKV